MLFLGWAERKRPLRPRTEDDLDHTIRNLALAGSSLLISQTAERAVVPAMFQLAEDYHFGLLRNFPISSAAKKWAGFLALDYSLYVWHWLNHRLPPLWRGHLVHHIDVDMDTTTGIRFHFWELLATLALRVFQVFVLGVDRAALQLWNRVLLLGVLFQHSNLELPPALEEMLSAVVVTPRLHAVHHSQVQEEGDSNFSSLLTCWDRLHGTLRTVPLDRKLVMGIPAYPDPTPLDQCLRLPFGPQKPAWPED